MRVSGTRGETNGYCTCNNASESPGSWARTILKGNRPMRVFQLLTTVRISTGAGLVLARCFGFRGGEKGWKESGLFLGRIRLKRGRP